MQLAKSNTSLGKQVKYSTVTTQGKHMAGVTAIQSIYLLPICANSSPWSSVAAQMLRPIPSKIFGMIALMHLPISLSAMHSHFNPCPVQTSIPVRCRLQSPKSCHTQELPLPRAATPKSYHPPRATTSKSYFSNELPLQIATTPTSYHSQWHLTHSTHPKVSESDCESDWEWLWESVREWVNEVWECSVRVQYESECEKVKCKSEWM
jgi:hypothetical protein